jgi:uncharacterized delta-60 repeat protein
MGEAEMKHQLTINRLIVFLSGVLCSIQVAAVFAAPGDLDTTFAVTSKLRFGFGLGNDNGNAVAVQAGGKYVVAGSSVNGSFSDISVVRYNADGSLDTSFGAGGKVLTSIGADDDFGRAIKIQTDGKIVVAGYSARVTGFFEIAVVRYHPDGSLDTSFGGDGIVTTAISAGHNVCNALAIQANGKIVVAGSSNNGVSDDFAVVRYNPNGSLDTSFDGDGKAITPTEGIDSSANAIAIQTDGKIVAAGESRGNVVIVRYNTNGSLDTSFGDGGIEIESIYPFGEKCNAVTIQTDGKIIVVGRTRLGSPGSGSDFVIYRRNSDGSRDASFGNPVGRVMTEITPTNPNYSADAEAIAVAIQPGNAFQPDRIVVAGYGTSGAGNKDFALVRYNADGSHDTSFDGDGILTTAIGAGNDSGNAMVIQGTGFEFSKITVVGSGSVDFNSDVAIVRYNTNGSLDTSFDNDGKNTTDVGNYRASANGVAIQTDGKIVMAGSSRSVVAFDFAVSRYNPDGTPDMSFDGDGKVVTQLSGDGDEANAVAIQTDGKIVVAGYRFNLTNTDFAVVRYNPDGSFDTSFDGDGKVSTPVGTGNDIGRAVAIQADGKIVVAGVSFSGSSASFALVRYHTNGSLDASFDTDGKVTTPIGAGNDQGNALAIQTDGRIIVAGFVFNGSNTDFGVVRYNLNGSLDTSFDGDGKVITPIGAGGDAGYAAAIQADGKIVVAGSSSNGANNDFAVVRYNTNGSLDASFDTDGKVTTQIGAGNDQGNALAIQADGKIAVAGQSLVGANNNDFAAVRYHTNGSLDGLYGSGGKVVVDVSNGGNDVGNGVALDSTGRAFVVGASENLFGVVRIEDDICSPVLSRTNHSFAASGGSGSVEVTAPDTCVWAATSNNPGFITVTSGTNGSGNATVTYSVSPHNDTTGRIGSITIGGHTFTVLQGAAFLDVQPDNPFYTEIGKLSARGVALGCGGGNYCPDSLVTREQMAAFIIRALGEFNPPTPASQRFTDVPQSNFFYAFIEEMALRQITLGCGVNTYCPSDPVTREQMAAFIIRALHEPGYVPPPPASQRFNDVGPSNPFYAYIEEMAVRGVTLGCSASPPLYCPGDRVTRAQMAAFLVRAFGL